MKRMQALGVALMLGACNSPQPPASGTLNVTIDGNTTGAVLLRVAGPRPFSVTSASSSVYLQSDTASDALSVAIFGDRLSGVVGQLKMLDGASASSYTVTVTQAADTGNKTLDPSSVRVSLVSGSGQ